MLGSLQSIENSLLIIFQFVCLQISLDLPSILLIFFHYLSHFHHLFRFTVLEVVGGLVYLLPHVGYFVENEA